MKKLQKGVSDLGAAAYILMHEDYRVAGRQGKSIFFEVEGEKEADFDDLKLEYLSSEFHRFDSCLMSLKKIDEAVCEFRAQKFVTDLGAAAFLLMHKFRVVGRKGKAVYFEVTTEEEAKQFDELTLEYLSSDFHKFDSCLMSLKKIGEFITDSSRAK